MTGPALHRPSKAPSTLAYASEKVLAGHVHDRLRKGGADGWGGSSFNVHGGGTSQVSGHPDVIATVPSLGGRLLAVELKHLYAREPWPTTLQYKRLREWRDAGGLAGWACTVAEVDMIIELALEDPTWENPQLFPDRRKMRELVIA